MGVVLDGDEVKFEKEEINLSDFGHEEIKLAELFKNRSRNPKESG